MKIFVEKEAEEFLEKRGFGLVKRVYIKKKSEIKNVIKKIDFPVVMKVSGKKIIHKNKIGGIKLGIKSYRGAMEAFRQLEEIKGFEGVIIQRQIKGNEFLLGIKKTPFSTPILIVQETVYVLKCMQFLFFFFYLLALI